MLPGVHLQVPNRRVPARVLQQLVRVGRSAVAAAAARGWVHVDRRSRCGSTAPCRPGEFAIVQGSAADATAAGTPDGGAAKDVAWRIQFDDLSLHGRSTVTVVGAGRSATNGVYRRLTTRTPGPAEQLKWRGFTVFKQECAAKVSAGYYGRPLSSIVFDSDPHADIDIRGRWQITSDTGEVVYASADRDGHVWAEFGSGFVDAPTPCTV